MSTDSIVLSAEQSAACLPLVDATRELGSAKGHTLTTARVALLAVDWLAESADGLTVTEAGKSGNQSALARAIVPMSWSDPAGPVVLVWASAQSVAGKAAKVAAQDGAFLLATCDAGTAVAPELLAAARLAVARWDMIKDVQNVQNALSDALKAAKPKAAPVSRGTRDRDKPADDAPKGDAPKGDAPVSLATPADRVSSALTLLGSLGQSPTAAGITVTDADKLAKAAAKVGGTAPSDPVAAILAMSDADAHAALQALATGLERRGGNTVGTKAVSAYVRSQLALAKAAVTAATI